MLLLRQMKKMPHRVRRHFVLNHHDIGPLELVPQRIQSRRMDLVIRARRDPNHVLRMVIDENKTTVFKWKSRILQAVTYAIDNQLADQSKDPVQVDFFTAQVFIWIGKMMQYTSIPFKRADIFKPEDYDARYPSTYLAELNVV